MAGRVVIVTGALERHRGGVRPVAGRGPATR